MSARWLLSLAVVLPEISCYAAGTSTALMSRRPFVINLEDGTTYQSLLKGPPQTRGFHAGRVVLMPGKAVGVHNTEIYEEVLLVLEGSGQAIAKGHDPLEITAGSLVYIPPSTQHNVKNTGDTPLRYVYVVAPTE